VGYNMEIKHQTDTVRDNYPGTNVNGKTIIRYNVFCKESNGSGGGNARPNVLVGAFPSSGVGSMDYYEIYGNFFYQNPTEALLQVTGNTTLYENIFVNHSDPAGFRAVYITAQNGFQPRDIKIFHNTVWAANSSGGIRLFNPNTSFQQYCYANAVFAPASITNFTNSVDNVTDSYANASSYVLSATTNLASLILYPQSGQLTGALTSGSLFQTFTDWDIDFNGDTYNWTFRGAYSGCCTNNGWQLQLDTMPTPTGTLTGISNSYINIYEEIFLFPNPASSQLNFSLPEAGNYLLTIKNTLGETILIKSVTEKEYSVDVKYFPAGIYFVTVTDEKKNTVAKKFVKM